EVFSGHGNAEEYREWREVILNPDGTMTCPEPVAGYLPSCWRAGEIIRQRCQTGGEPDDVCEARAVEARQHYLRAGVQGHLTVPGATLKDWLDAGQCTDCFLPAFNHRPRSSVQYMMARSAFDGSGDPLRFRFGFMASSDNHTARPGTGYKEYARTEMTEARFETFSEGIFGRRSPQPEAAPYSVPFDPTDRSNGFFGLRETERQASFFVTGGLVAVHATGRSREAVWQALAQKEVYGTSGPRILLWFDLINPPGGARLSMGAETVMRTAPTFEVRAVGSLEQRPGCPDYSLSALSEDRLQRLCRNECYNPSDRRRPISRIEVVRIRPQTAPGEPIAELIEDPWRVFPCTSDPAGCRVRFSDPAFSAAKRDALYYVRAIEEPSPAVNAGNLRCERDANGRCVRMNACVGAPAEEDCLAQNEERAWSSPIFVDFAQ
ncbi:MAG: DUF3604 domain-containing protein, partial [Planctomycetota bacterium]